jgi:phosphoribosylformylglycinamidine synthase
VIYLLGETLPELGGSEYAEVVLGKVSGSPPRLDLGRERRLQRLLFYCYRDQVLASAHDCSDGGLAIALAESAIAGDTGFTVRLWGDLAPHIALFSESASRVVVSATPEKAMVLERLAHQHRVPITRLGETGGTALDFGVISIPLEGARRTYEESFPTMMRGGTERAAG